VQALQEQDQDLTGAYSLCDEAALPGVGVDEYRGKNVHQQIGGERALSSQMDEPCRILDRAECKMESETQEMQPWKSKRHASVECDGGGLGSLHNTALGAWKLALVYMNHYKNAQHTTRKWGRKGIIWRRCIFACYSYTATLVKGTKRVFAREGRGKVWMLPSCRTVQIIERAVTCLGCPLCFAYVCI